MYTNGLAPGTNCFWCDEGYYANRNVPSDPCQPIEPTDAIPNCLWTIKEYDYYLCKHCGNNTSPSVGFIDCSSPGQANCEVAARSSKDNSLYCLKCDAGYTSIDGTCTLSTGDNDGCYLVRDGGCRYCDNDAGYHQHTNKGACLLQANQAPNSTRKKDTGLINGSRTVSSRVASRREGDSKLQDSIFEIFD